MDASHADRSRARSTTALVLLLLVGAFAVPTGALAASAPPSPAGNGVLLMVHGNFEPAVHEAAGVPPAQEAFATTQDDGEVVLHLIPYTVSDAMPLEVSEPELTVRDATGSTLLQATPDGDPADHPTCEAETSLPGNEGPLAACLVFTFDADAFRGRELVTFELAFDLDGEDHVEVYNEAAHLALHASMEGAPVDRQVADDQLTQATPFVVEDLVDPVE